MKTIRYLAYGSNLHPIRLQERVPSARPISSVRLNGWCLAFHKRGSRDGSGKANLVVSANDHAFGAVFEMDESEVSILDHHEGAGFGYERRRIHFDGFGAVSTYLAQESHIDDSLRPFSWYRDLVMLGARCFRFPSDYLEPIETLKCLVDPDHLREAEHRALIRRIQLRNSHADPVLPRAAPHRPGAPQVDER